MTEHTESSNPVGVTNNTPVDFIESYLSKPPLAHTEGCTVAACTCDRIFFTCMYALLLLQAVGIALLLCVLLREVGSAATSNSTVHAHGLRWGLLKSTEREYYFYLQPTEASDKYSNSEGADSGLSNDGATVRTIQNTQTIQSARQSAAEGGESTTIHRNKEIQYRQ